MNKQEKIRKLTWNYFLEQKAKEIFTTLIIVLGVIFIPFGLGSLVGDGVNEVCGDDWGTPVECNWLETWFEGLIYIAILGFIGTILWMWIENNWNKALEKAKRDYRKKKKIVR